MGIPWSALNSVAHMFILSHLQLTDHGFSMCFPWIPHGEPWKSHEFNRDGCYMSELL